MVATSTFTDQLTYMEVETIPTEIIIPSVAVVGILVIIAVLVAFFALCVILRRKISLLSAKTTIR